MQTKYMWLAIVLLIAGSPLTSGAQVLRGALFQERACRSFTPYDDFQGIC